MKEDKLDKEIAASLKKKLVEASVPYELGAWEAFQKMRAKRKRKAIAYWATGVAASLLLIAIGISSVDLPLNLNENAGEVQVADNTDIRQEITSKQLPTKDSAGEKSIPEPGIESNSKNLNKTPAKTPAIGVTPSETLTPEVRDAEDKTLATDPKIEQKSILTEKATISPELPALANQKAVAQVPEKPFANQPEQALITKLQEEKNEETSNSSLVIKAPEKIALAQAEESVNPQEKEAFVAESDFPVIEKDKTSVGLGMGLSPGFGAVQSDNQVATASSIGLGMLVDIKLPGKLTLGSGLGLNYYNQNAKQESMVMSFGNNYPQTEKLEVQQMQVEVPVFVKYPVTRNNSVSVQAGFSNFYSLNGTASQEFTVQKQLAFYANDAMGNSSVSLRQEAVVENNSLESKSGRFYPFATLNFGVNLRVLETKGANYVIMPFYNYQLKQVSGYGDTYGLFGASFKMNFGGK
ncbi:hypothetical protein [Algoriphagus winogradskyi]|uniref:Outer membrane protein beta-barrel domain-containing protein n=1 Tax=Algoriphagus winogradskyi TaxID=237017 RepID=A0ABY1P0C2_9BACT|nr:hypothetical protein [Algoriphagus winogradskyi]SMP21955.1 hypothetical protein SAMN06265367_103391 [Algoriphagus winogradskyi]